MARRRTETHRADTCPFRQYADALVEWRSLEAQELEITVPEADINFVEAYRAGHAIQAHAIKHALEDAGIPVMIENEALQDAIGDFPPGWSSSPRLMVPDSQLESAREIIRQTDHSEQTAGRLTSSETAASVAAAMLGWFGVALMAASAAPSDESEQTETTRCLACDAVMAESEETCSKCGWSYEPDDSAEPQ